MSGLQIFGGILFGSIGLAAFIYGKKQSSLTPLLVGIALMIYPYFVSNAIVLYGVGALLIALLFIFR